MNERTIIDAVIRLGFIGLFAYWSLTLVAPFVPIVLWAIVLTVALYPIYEWLTRLLFGKRGLAAAVITIIGLLIVLGPAGLLLAGIVEWAVELASKLRDGTLSVPPPWDSIKDIPFIGTTVFEAWSEASTNLAAFATQHGGQLKSAGGAVLGSLAGLGGSMLAFAASMLIAGFLFIPAPKGASAARGFARRIVGERGEGFVDMAGATIRNVSRGVIGISLLQALLAGVGLLVMGVPGAGPISLVILIFGIVQIGAGLPCIAVLIWAWATQDTTAAVILTAYLIPVALIDNVLKPIVMSQGLSTPMLLILIGVIGGTLTHGLIGLFLGPIVLAVFYELLVAWVASDPPDAETSTRDSGGGGA